MTRLLVSVRDAIEARTALAAGADLIDLKEPSRGSLGAVEAAVAQQCLRVVDGRAPVSLALGELLEFDATLNDVIPCGAAYAKLGLAGCADCADWQTRWSAACDRLPQGTAAVAVVYADWLAARAPAPIDVLTAAAAQTCRAVLVDTYDKSSGGLLERWTIDGLVRFARAVRRTDMLLVLAGSLDQHTIRRVLPLEPDYVAVRGAACAGGRAGRLDAQRVRELSALVHGDAARNRGGSGSTAD